MTKAEDQLNEIREIYGLEPDEPEAIGLSLPEYIRSSRKRLSERITLLEDQVEDLRRDLIETIDDLRSDLLDRINDD